MRRDSRRLSAVVCGGRMQPPQRSTEKGAQMAIEISFAITEAQRQAVYRLRYEQYCEAQGLLLERAAPHFSEA